LCRWVCGFRLLKDHSVFIVKDQAVQEKSKNFFLGCLILKMKTVCSFKKLGIACPTTKCSIPKDPNPYSVVDMFHDLTKHIHLTYKFDMLKNTCLQEMHISMSKFRICCLIKMYPRKSLFLWCTYH